jgi:hypothetical protein
MMMKEFDKLCTPAKVYFAIAVIATVIGLFNGFSIMVAFWKLLFAFIWTYVLGWLCSKGWTPLSWFLVLLPYIIIVLAMLNIYHVSHSQKQMMRNVQLQGAYGQEPFTGRPAPRMAPPPKKNKNATSTNAVMSLKNAFKMF